MDAIGYCENIASFIISQPLNVISNLAFFVVAFLVEKQIKKNHVHEYGIRLLPEFLVLVGVASTLWHAIPAPWSALADEFMAVLFGAVIVYLFFERLISNQFRAALVTSLLFVLGITVNIAGNLNPFWYVLIVGVLAYIGYFSFNKFPSARRLISVSILFFLLAVVLHALDTTFCGSIPLGTHFVWHLFSAVGSYYIILAVLRMDSVQRR